MKGGLPHALSCGGTNAGNGVMPRNGARGMGMGTERGMAGPVVAWSPVPAMARMAGNAMPARAPPVRW